MTRAAVEVEPAPESGPDVIIRGDQSGVILYVSGTCSVLGYEPHELIGMLGLDLVHPDDRARFIENTASIFDPSIAARPERRVHRFRCKDGSWVWLRGHPTRLPSVDGRPGELLNFFEPISAEAAAKALQD
jgi:PAS domain S-box-containing protein